MEGEGSEGPVAARGNCKTLDRTVAASATGAVTGAPLVIACRGRARNLVFEAYKRLGVHKYTEIGKFVW